MNKRIFRNVGIVLSGNAVSQAIFFIATIFLTRLYSPAAFGAFAIFLAWTNIIGLLLTARYETVIPLPVSSIEANHILWGALAISLGLFLSGSVSSLFICFFFRAGPEFHPFLIILSAYFLGAMSLIHFLLIRWEHFAMLSGIRILMAIGVSGIQLGLYAIAPGIGMVTGYLWGSGLTLLISVLLIFKKPIERPSPGQIKATIKKYYPIIQWSLPSGLLNTVSNNVQPLLIGLAFGNREAGLFFLSYKVLGAPIILISGSIAQVFLKEAAVALQKNDKQLLLTLLKNISAFMSISIFLFFAAFFFMAGPLFTYLFGEEWIRSSLMAIWLIPYFWGKGIFHPVSFLAEALNRTKLEMQFSLVSLLIMIAAILIGCYFDSIKVFILIFSIGTGMAYLFLWVVFYQIILSGNYERKV